jgi:gluconokinase
MSTAASPPASEGVAVVVMGVSGSGKTTVGLRLAGALGAQFVDGDDLHTDAARAKMKSGHPLTDDDRWPWLDRIGAKLATGERTVIACSALRRVYRDRLRAATGPKLRFVYLEATPEDMGARVAGGVGHYMPASLVESQFAALEPPSGEADVITVSADGDLDAEIPTLAERVRRQIRPE